MTARSSRSPKKLNKGGRDAMSPSRRRREEAAKAWYYYNRRHQSANLKAPRAKSGKSLHSRPNSDANMLLHRLSPPSCSPLGTLLERIGGSAEEEEEQEEEQDELLSSSLSLSDRIDEARMESVMSTTPPHLHTPDPGEVEQFLDSVIDVLPSSGSGYAACLGKSTLALETHNLSDSPTQTVHSSSLAVDAAMSLPSASTLEECRKHLAPVLLASARSRDAGKRLDSDQYLRLLSDDHCRSFFRQAKEMRHQLSSLVSPKAPVTTNRSWSGPLKRDARDDDEEARVDAHHWVRNTRSRFDSANTVISPKPSRRDSDITLVDVASHQGVTRLPPKAPRAMLQTSQGNKLSYNGAHPRASQAVVPSPIAQDCPPSTTALLELVHQAINIFPSLMATANPPETEMDISGVSVERLPTSGSAEQLDSTTSAHCPSADFVSHLSTQSGVWFKQRGKQYAEIVDVEIEVSDEIFYMSKDHRPFRLRTHLRLCSVPVQTPLLPPRSQDTDDVIDPHTWPKKGKLVVQVNPESERSKTWLPHKLESDPLDVTAWMHPGKNTFRFIQLSDLSQFTFMLVASPPPPEEEWRSWDWESFFIDHRSSQSFAEDDPNGLAEFARVPVTVRS